MILKFTEQDAADAYEAWGFNCGPAALCAATGLTPQEVRPVFEELGFAAKGYTNPTMMKAALAKCGWKFLCQQQAQRDGRVKLPADGIAIIQWRGPWMDPGVNPKWAYRHTHYVASLRLPLQHSIFDINGGLRTFESWRAEIVPLLTAAVPRADGSWFVTHIWEVDHAE